MLNLIKAYLDMLKQWIPIAILTTCGAAVFVFSIIAPPIWIPFPWCIPVEIIVILVWFFVIWVMALPSYEREYIMKKKRDE